MPDLGFTTGYLQAQQADQKNQLFKLSMQEGQQDVEAKDMSIQQAKRALKIQDDVAKAMKAKGAGDGGIGGLTEQLQAGAQAQLADGNVEGALETLSKASTLAKNDADIKQSQYEQQVQGLDLAGNLLEGVHDKDTLGEAIMNFTRLDENRDPKVTEMLQKLATQPYNQKAIDALKAGVMTSKERAAKQASEASAKATDIENQQAPLRADALKAKTESDRAYARHMDKMGAVPKAPADEEWVDPTDLSKGLRPIPGGKLDTKEQEKTEGEQKSLGVAEAQIDDLTKLIDEHKAITGGMGFLRRGGEWIVSTVGITDKVPATEFADKMQLLEAQAPNLLQMGGSKKLGVDQRKLLVDAISGLHTATSGAQAKQKLKDLKEVLQIIKGGDTATKGTVNRSGKVPANRISKVVDGTTYYTDDNGKNWFPQ